MHASPRPLASRRGRRGRATSVQRQGGAPWPLGPCGPGAEAGRGPPSPACGRGVASRGRSTCQPSLVFSASSNVFDGVRPPIALPPGLWPPHQRAQRQTPLVSDPHGRRTHGGSGGAERGGSHAHRWPVSPHNIVAGAEAAHAKLLCIIAGIAGRSSSDLPAVARHTRTSRVGRTRRGERCAEREQERTRRGREHGGADRARSADVIGEGVVVGVVVQLLVPSQPRHRRLAQQAARMGRGLRQLEDGQRGQAVPREIAWLEARLGRCLAEHGQVVPARERLRERRAPQSLLRARRRNVQPRE